MKHNQSVDAMRGAFSAIFTPFDLEGHVNFDMLTKIAEFQLGRGLNGFFVAGSTGEGLLLTDRERLAVIGHMVDLCQGRATVIAHVGHSSTHSACQLAERAANKGVDWISAIGPIFHGKTFDGAFRHYEQISNASDLPFMMYAFDGQINAERDYQFFELPNVCGLKYTGSNYFSVQQLVQRIDQRISVMSGFDEQFVAALSSGLNGAIGSTFNFAPEIYVQIFQLFTEGKIKDALRLQMNINKVTSLMTSHENWSYRKAIMKYLGFDCGAARPPYAPLSDNQYQAFANQLEQLKVLNVASADGR